MQATLIRFGPELLEVAKAEADAAGVSFAQYVREAVLTRVAYTAGRRGDRAYEDALDEVTGTPIAAESRRLREEDRALIAFRRSRDGDGTAS